MTKARDIADSELGSLTVDTDTLVVDETNNRVGIGASSPSQALDVNGTSNATNLTRGGSQVYSRNNILGTVSESSGTPTGAIIERGSNSNGEFVKYADGTMICHFYDEVTDQSISAAYGSLYQGTRVWTYPSSFVNIPSVSCGLGRWGTSASWSGLSSSSSVSSFLRFWDIFLRNSGTSMDISATAIGRWY